MGHIARSSAYIQASPHGTFYFRIRVPVELVEPLRCSHIKRSLKTKDRREAIRRCSALLEATEGVFQYVAQGKTVDLSSIHWDAYRRSEIEPPALVEEENAQQLLSEVAREFCDQQLKEGVSLATVKGKQAVVSLVGAIIGDKPIDLYSRSDARRFKSQALQLPPYALQLLKQKSLSRVIEEASETISSITFNNYIKNLTSVFTYAKREGYCESDPFEGLKLKQERKSNQYRGRYSQEELSVLFETIRADVHYLTKPYRKWLPLLGLYTGARMNELCQLYLEDVVQFDGIDCIHIRAIRPDQRLKNLASERVIPLHPALIKQGFMDYVSAARAKGHQRLFEELTFHARHNYIHAPSRWFSKIRYRAGFNSDTEKKDFHSLRHTVADYLKQQGVAESLISGLLGHQSASITLSRYGKDYEPLKLLEAVERLDFRL